MIYATGDLHGNSLRFQPQYFPEQVRSRNQFHYWLFGHYHDNRVIDEKYVMLYEQMVRVL